MLNTIPMETKYVLGDLQFYGWPSPAYFCPSSPYPYSTPEQGLTDPTGRWVLES